MVLKRLWLPVSGSCFFNDNLRFLCIECTSRQWRLLNFKDVCIKKSWGSHSSTVWEKERQQRAQWLQELFFISAAASVLESTWEVYDFPWSRAPPLIGKKGKEWRKGLSIKCEIMIFFTSQLCHSITEATVERACAFLLDLSWLTQNWRWMTRFRAPPISKSFSLFISLTTWIMLSFNFFSVLIYVPVWTIYLKRQKKRKGKMLSLITSTKIFCVTTANVIPISVLPVREKKYIELNFVSAQQNYSLRKGRF